MKQIRPGVGVSFKKETLTLGRNPDSRGLQLHTPGCNAFTIATFSSEMVPTDFAVIIVLIKSKFSELVLQI